MSFHPAVAYKVLTGAEMDSFEQCGSFKGSPVDLADGFIHMSTAGQLDETVNRHFSDQNRLFVLTVDLAALGDAVKWEPSRGGAMFPHLYGALPKSAVIAHGQLARAPDGSIIVPGGEIP